MTERALAEKQKASGSFLKKRTKKLLPIEAGLAGGAYPE